MSRLLASIAGKFLGQNPLRMVSLRSGFTPVKPEAVDIEAGIIRGVSVITAGTARPANGDPFTVDAITLSQVAEVINAAGERGVKSRLEHPELKGEDGILSLVGTIRNARVDGDRVRGDFHLGSYARSTPRGDLGAYLLGVAQEQPEDIGLSIVISAGRLERVDGALPVARITGIAACDWVGTPAANPGGLLSGAGPDDSPAGEDDPPKTALEGKSKTMYTESQIAYLRSLGLPDGATDEQIEQFIAGLTTSQRDALDAATAESGGGSEEPGVGGDGSGGTGGGDGRDRGLSGRSPEVIRMQGITELASLSGLGDSWANRVFLSGATIDQARAQAVQAKAAKRQPVTLGTINVGADRNIETLNAAVQDAIMLRANAPLYQDPSVDGGDARGLCLAAPPAARKPHERSREFRGRTLLDIGRRYLCALGITEADNWSKPQLARVLMSRRELGNLMNRNGATYLSHATGDFPGLLADTMGKTLRAAYALRAPKWPVWCAKGTAPDFKPVKRLQLSEAADLKQMAEGEEYTVGYLDESGEQYHLIKWGKSIAFTRESMINDDLDAFGRTPIQMANAARRREDFLSIQVLTANAVMADGNALFSTAHRNLTTGALNTANLGLARAVMHKQYPQNGTPDQPLELEPSVLIVPTELSATAEQLVASTVDPAKQNATPNLRFIQDLTVVASARLSATSTAQWYLAASPADLAMVEILFLEGEEGPTIEEEDEFDTDTRKIKVRHHCAAKSIDWLAGVRSSGS
jgi:hypothetical protein